MTETRPNFLRYLCLEASFLINPAFCAVNGTLAGRGLNLASISISQLVGSETVSRTFTSVDAGSGHLDTERRGSHRDLRDPPDARHPGIERIGVVERHLHACHRSAQRVGTGGDRLDGR